jgi:hypothetical protein
LQTTELTIDQFTVILNLLGAFYAHPSVEELMSPTNSGVSELLPATEAIHLEPALKLRDTSDDDRFLYLVVQVDFKLVPLYVPPTQHVKMHNALLASSLITPRFFVVVDADQHGRSEHYRNGIFA